MGRQPLLGLVAFCAGAARPALLFIDHIIPYHPTYSPLGRRTCTSRKRVGAAPKVPLPQTPKELEERIQRVRRQRQRLLALLRRLEFPLPTSFTAFGKDYPLPLKSKGGPEAPHEQELLEYLGGFFAASGSASLTAGKLLTPEVSLQVRRPLPDAGILFLFQSMFRGAITADKCQTGVRQATLRWRVAGPWAQRAAATLMAVTPGRRAQLATLAGRIPLDEEEWQKLRASWENRKSETEGTEISTWCQFAGHFDARGSCGLDEENRIYVGGLSTRLSSFTGATVNFLRSNGIQARTGPRGEDIGWKVVGEPAREVLALMIGAGLLIKKPLAELLLPANIESPQWLRKVMMMVERYQMKAFERLDAAGMKRDKEIKRLRARLKTWHKQGEKGKAASLQFHLERLSKQNKLIKLEDGLAVIRQRLRETIKEFRKSDSRPLPH